jgi:hypothetical protein
MQALGLVVQHSSSHNNRQLQQVGKTHPKEAVVVMREVGLTNSTASRMGSKAVGP